MKELINKKVTVTFNHQNHRVKGYITSCNDKGLFITIESREYRGPLPFEYSFVPFQSILMLTIESHNED